VGASGGIDLAEEKSIVVVVLALSQRGFGVSGPFEGIVADAGRAAVVAPAQRRRKALDHCGVGSPVSMTVEDIAADLVEACKTSVGPAEVVRFVVDSQHYTHVVVELADRTGKLAVEAVT